MVNKSQSLDPVSETNPPSPTAFAAQTLSYWVDAWQRTILFWDVLRQRSEEYYQQKAKPIPLSR